ncbi:MAG: hypothetical protein NTW85_12080 [Methylococcales bacterium]|nr:hypothetical protein [Methylococcales bacterium]
MGILSASLKPRTLLCSGINYKMAVTVLVLPLMISGCASVSGYPDRLIETEAALKEVRPIVERKNIDACNEKSCRNKILSAEMIGVDINFSEFERKLFRETREVTFLTTVTTLALTTAGAMTGTAVLSGIATGVVSSKQAFDKEILLDQAKNAIHTQMRALRQTVANRIRYGMKQSFEEYPLNAAIIDIEEYYNAGTLLGAFVGITASAGLQIKESEVNKDLISQNKAPVTFSPLISGVPVEQPTTPNNTGTPQGPPLNYSNDTFIADPLPSKDQQPKGCEANECKLDKNEVRQIQQTLCIKSSGDFDEQTKEAIKLFRATNVVNGNERDSGKLHDTEISFLISKKDCRGFQNAYERFFFGQDVSPSAKTDLTSFAAQLTRHGVQNVPPNPQNLDDLRPSIKQFQETQKKQPTGVLTPELQDSLSDG